MHIFFSAHFTQQNTHVYIHNSNSFCIHKIALARTHALSRTHAYAHTQARARSRVHTGAYTKELLSLVRLILQVSKMYLDI